MQYNQSQNNQFYVWYITGQTKSYIMTELLSSIVNRTIISNQELNKSL